MYKLSNSSKENTNSQRYGRLSLDISQKKEPSHSDLPLPYAQLSSSPEPQSGASFEVERQIRRLKLQGVRHRRTSNHIFSFIRIHVQVNDQSFPVTSARTSTIEDLARQIEAEYAFNYACSPAGPTLSGIDSEEEYAKMDLLSHLEEYDELEVSEGQLKPLVCGSLFVDQVELRFSDVVGEVLNMNDSVRVVNVYEAPAPSTSSVDTRASSCSDKKRWSFPNIKRSLRAHSSYHSRVHSATESDISHGRRKSYNDGSSTAKKDWKDNFMDGLDERFQTILFNNVLLSHFQRFCLQEYAIENLLFWIEVELFRNTMLSLVPNVAHYIYQTYIAKDSPLQVNLCDEIRDEIPVSFVSEENYLPDITIFDEAQEYVYEMLMHHTFQCFEESNCYEQMLNQCQLDLDRLSKSIGPQPLGGLTMDIELIESVITDIRVHHDRKDEGWFKEDILERIIKHHFPNCPSTGHNYFCDGRRLTLAQKRRKIRLEKKLSKFFGQRLTEEELTQQRLFEAMDSSRRSSITSISSLPSYISSKTPGKKKKLGKLEKLECFFGKRLPNTQLEYQNLISRKDLCLPAECSNCQRIPPESTLPISTYNDLSSEERRVLTKRSRKLKCLLGEPIDEQTAFKSLTYPVINRRSSIDLDTCSLPESVMSDPLPSPAPLYRRTSKEVKRMKLVKLYQLLGTYPSVDDLKIKSSMARKDSLLDRNGKPLAPEIKRLRLKKANKLERVFGQHPPKDLIVDKRNDSTPRKRASVLSLLVENEASVDDLVEYIQALALLNDSDSPSTEEEELLSTDLQPHSTSSAPKVLEERGNNLKSCEDISGNKATRQRKLAKLRRFFGNDLGLESLIAQNILLRHQLATEGLYSLQDLSHHSLEDFDLINNESFVRTAMKNDLETLRREVEELRRQTNSTSPVDVV